MVETQPFCRSLFILAVQQETARKSQSSTAFPAHGHEPAFANDVTLVCSESHGTVASALCARLGTALGSVASIVCAVVGNAPIETELIFGTVHPTPAEERLDHLALRSLAEVGMPASSTQLLAGGGYVFLEVQRFDRIGLNGRVGMLSAGSVDVMAAFSELIGNNDRHFENISLLIREDGEYQGAAPAYDILPMRYASLGGGVDPDLTPIEPKVGTIGAQPAVWACAAKAAERFWLAAMNEDLPAPLSPEMRQLAHENLKVARAFVAPFLPR